MTRLAKKITVDLEQKKLFIDGGEFPYHILPGVQVNSLLDNSAIPTVDISIFAETIEVIPEVKK